MTASAYDMTARRGETFITTMTIAAEDDDTPLDLTTAAIFMQVRRSADSSTAILDMSLANKISLTGTPGQFMIEIDADSTADLPTGIFQYDLCTVIDGTTTYWLAGTFTIEASVTKV